MIPELASRDGSRVPVDLPDGECVLTRLADETIRVDHADPRILISAELLDSIADGPAPEAWLDLAGCATYDGAILRINGVNRTVIYRITGYAPAIRAYIAEWPD